MLQNIIISFWLARSARRCALTSGLIINRWTSWAGEPIHRWVGPSPCAEVNYKHQFGNHRWRASGVLKSTTTSFRRGSARQDSHWVAVSVGAHLPLGNNLAAFASFTQGDGMSSGEQFIYNPDVSARFQRPPVGIKASNGKFVSIV